MHPSTSNLGHYANSASYFIGAPAPQAAPPPAPQPCATSTTDTSMTSFKKSRKRSRDDLDDMDDDSSHTNTEPFPSELPTPSPTKREAILGPGMTMIYEDGPIVDATSQTGTWAEELSERLRTSELARDEKRRPGLDSRKSIRLDRSEAGMDDVTAATLPRDARFAIDPTIDEASVALGIGWSSIPATPAMAAATRGWARHIETHFPLQSVKIVWRNTSIPAYLVSAATCADRGRGMSPAPVNGRSASWHRQAGSPGYYLFDEAMTQGRLVAKSWERALGNLRGVPFVFDGEHMMESDGDEVLRHSEQNNDRHWGWQHAVSRSATPPVGVVEKMQPDADGMDLD